MKSSKSDWLIPAGLIALITMGGTEPRDAPSRRAD
jgi:hypothetical protein